MQKILGYMRKAVDNYNMIKDGDRILVALSGGKDSTTLLLGLKNLQRFYPKSFELLGVTINPGFENFDTTNIYNLCKNLNIPYIEEKTHIKEIVFDIRKEKNPCSLCANLRRGILNSSAIAHGCNKIALGHNEDDVLETFFLNLLYAGNLSTFAPTSYMDRSKITLIRPMVYIPEKEVRKFVRRQGIEVMPKVCPMDGVSKRESIKELISKLVIEIPTVRANIMGAIRRSNINGWKEF